MANFGSLLCRALNVFVGAITTTPTTTTAVTTATTTTTSVCHAYKLMAINRWVEQVSPLQHRLRLWIVLHKCRKRCAATHAHAVEAAGSG